jgi:Domain of unknown function (DUF1996)
MQRTVRRPVRLTTLHTLLGTLSLLSAAAGCRGAPSDATLEALRASASEAAAGGVAPEPHHAHGGQHPAQLAAQLQALAQNESALPLGEVGTATLDVAPSDERPAHGDGVGAFRTVCDFSHMNFDDPIVFPDQPGKAHLHAFFGNTDVDSHTTAESLREGGNSTCRGGIANRSGYWAPAVIDADGEAVAPRSLETYYKSGYNGIAPEQIHALPRGLRMIAGDAKSTAPQTRAYWGCRDQYIGHPGSVPNCSDGGLAMIVEFPQCWDGKHLDSSDHKRHMAYPVDGQCPDTHPVAIPAITMNVIYDAPPGGSAGWRLSSDMYDDTLPGGMSAHADWFDGWEPEIAETFVERCVRSGVDCHSHLLGDGRQIY